jgi:hypothetical protein
MVTHSSVFITYRKRADPSINFHIDEVWKGVILLTGCVHQAESHKHLYNTTQGTNACISK